jgi:hypothetical protein
MSLCSLRDDCSHFTALFVAIMMSTQCGAYLHDASDKKKVSCQDSQ